MPETLIVSDLAQTDLKDNDNLTFLDSVDKLKPESINSFHFQLPVFKGPLDLLLHLIRKHKIDIYDIPIIQITRQYLDYIELLKELDLEIAGEFLVMAATLIYIKSRMLLPPEEEESEESAEDPRAELVRRLLEYKSYQESSLHLRKREEIWKNVFNRNVPEDSEFEPEPVLFEANVFDLITAFNKLLEKSPEQVMEITRESLTVTDRMNFIVAQIEKEDGMKFEDLFEGVYTRIVLIVTFLALLELVKLGLVKIVQEKAFGYIWLLSPGPETDTKALVEAEAAGADSNEVLA